MTAITGTITGIHTLTTGPGSLAHPHGVPVERTDISIGISTASPSPDTSAGSATPFTITIEINE